MGNYPLPKSGIASKLLIAHKEKRRILEDPASGFTKKKAIPFGMAFWGKAPGDDLLLHGLSHTTIGAVAFHFRVRDGIGWFHNAMVTRERVEGRVVDRCFDRFAPHSHSVLRISCGRSERFSIGVTAICVLRPS